MTLLFEASRAFHAAMATAKAAADAVPMAEGALRTARARAERPQPGDKASDLLAAVDAAETNLRHAVAAARIESALVETARAAHADALHEAALPAVAAARAARLESCKKADAARVMLEEARAEFIVATWPAGYRAPAGLAGQLGLVNTAPVGQPHQWSVPTEEHEVALWASVGE